MLNRFWNWKVIPHEMPTSEEDCDRVDKFNIMVVNQYINKKMCMDEMLLRADEMLLRAYVDELYDKK
jgi:hypothetical protein